MVVWWALNPRSGYKRACNMGYCIESQDLAQPPRLQGLTWDVPVLPSKCKVRFSLSLAVVAGFYWLAGVGNESAHLFARSSAPFVCITKPGSPGIFQREHVTTTFYTRSGGLSTCPQNLIPTRGVEHWEKNHFPQGGMLKFTYKGYSLTMKIAYEKFLDWKSRRWFLYT
jgi:nitrate/TMAO reductase-like tetraheme cytochrome c subunit